MAKNKTPNFNLYSRIWREARPYGPKIAVIFLLSSLSTPLSLLNPLPLKIAIDSVLGSHPVPELLKALLPSSVFQSRAELLAVVALLVVIIALLNQLQDLGSSMLSTYVAEKMVLGFQTKLFRHVQRLSLAYHDTKGTSDSTYRIQYDAASLRYIMIDGLIPFVTAVITLVMMLYVCFRLDWQLAVVALTISPILFVLSRFYRLRLRAQSREIKHIETAALAVIHEVLTALRVVKGFGQEEHEEERFHARSTEGVRARMRLAFTSNGLGVLIGLTTAAGTAAVLFLGIRHVQSNVLTLGNLLLVMAYLAQLYEPLRTISRKVASLQTHFASAERVFALLDESPDVSEKIDARSLSRAQGAMAFRNVWFNYLANPPVLRDLSFEIRAGSKIGIAGKTGAGKTTLVNLLNRFYDPTAGQILLDGTDLRDYKIADLRNQFAIVLQETVLFSTTIAQNIAYARPEATEEEIVRAAKAADAHDFIMKLPKGYETRVGERGMLLSGGERQRVALARAFLKDAPLLILDEPTSSVDVHTEGKIIEAMESLMRGRTAFIIAHRLTTLRNCDLLLVFEDGQLKCVESDDPKSMLKALETGVMRSTAKGRPI